MSPFQNWPPGLISPGVAIYRVSIKELICKVSEFKTKKWQSGNKLKIAKNLMVRLAVDIIRENFWNSKNTYFWKRPFIASAPLVSPVVNFKFQIPFSSQFLFHSKRNFDIIFRWSSAIVLTHWHLISRGKFLKSQLVHRPLSYRF